MEKHQILDSLARKKSLQLVMSTSGCTYYRNVDATIQERISISDYKIRDDIEIVFVMDIKDEISLDKAKRIIDIMNEA